MYRTHTTSTIADDSSAECDSFLSSESAFDMNSSESKKSVDFLCQVNDLSIDEKDLLRACWHHLAKHKADVAVEVFILIFKQCPETKKLFYFVDPDQPITSSKRTKDDNALQFHALRFIQIIESMIEHLDNVHELEPVLQGLGQLHLRFREKYGFQTYFWSVFCECTLYVFRDRLKHRTDDIDRAVTLWRLVLGAIKQKMRQGFRSGDRKRQDLRCSNVGQTSSSGASAARGRKEDHSPSSHEGNQARTKGELQNGDGEEECGYAEIGIQVTSDFLV